MKALALAVVGLLIGGAYYKMGTPSVQSYPAADGARVLKLTFTRAPWFVAYIKAPARALGPGRERA